MEFYKNQNTELIKKLDDYERIITEKMQLTEQKG